MFEKCARSSPSSRKCHISTAEGTGTIGAVELQAAANAQKQMQQANKFLKVALIGLLLIVLLLVGMMFAVLFIEAGGLVSQYPSILRQAGQTFEGPFSAVSKPICGSKYSVESSRRDLHNSDLCTDLRSQNFN